MKKQVPKLPHPDASGLSKAQALFLEAELAFPGIPTDLADRLEEREPWVFSTRPLPAWAYDIRQFVKEVRRGDVNDYAVLAHAGHGVNSYALHYYLVRGPLQLFLQLAWGGIYTNDEPARVHVRQCFSLADRLLKATGESVSEKRLDGSDRLLVVGSDFYGSEWWTPRGAPEKLRPDTGGQHVDSVLRAAMTFVETTHS